MDPQAIDDGSFRSETSSIDPSHENGGTTRVGNAEGRKHSDTTGKSNEKHFSNLLNEHQLLNSRSYSTVPSFSTDEKGWSTGVGSSSLSPSSSTSSSSSSPLSSSSNDDNSYNSILIQKYGVVFKSNSSEKEKQLKRMSDLTASEVGTDKKERVEDENSYDDLEDGSEWISENGNDSKTFDEDEERLSDSFSKEDEEGTEDTSLSQRKQFVSASTTTSPFRASAAFCAKISAYSTTKDDRHHTRSPKQDNSRIVNKMTTNDSPDQMSHGSQDSIRYRLEGRSYPGNNVSSPLSTYSSSEIRDFAQESSGFRFGDMFGVKDEAMISMFSSDQTTAVPRGSTPASRKKSGSVGKKISLSPVASTDDSESTAQDIFGSERRDLTPSLMNLSSDYRRNIKYASAYNISSLLIEGSLSTKSSKQSNNDALNVPNRTIDEGGCNSRRIVPSTFDGTFSSIASLRSSLKEGFSPLSVRGKKYPRAQGRKGKKCQANSGVYDSKSITTTMHSAKKSIESSKREILNSKSNIKESQHKVINRRHRKTRNIRNSSRYDLSNSAKISSIRSNISRNESNADKTAFSTPKIQVNTERATAAHPSLRKGQATKQLNRYRKTKSQNLYSYSTYYSGWSGKTKGQLKDKSGANLATKSASKPERSRKKVNVERSRKKVNVDKDKERLRNLYRGTQVESYSSAEIVGKSSNCKGVVPNGLYFSKSFSFLNDYDCGLKPTMKRIHTTINNEGYKILVKKTYYKLLDVRPRLKYLISLSEWLHVHMLLLYNRMFDCELYFHSIILPREFRIAIPDDIMIFEPIAAVIFSIGIVEELDMGVTYIPTPRTIRGDDIYRPHDKDDVTEFLEWTQYDWNLSWRQVEEARLERRKISAEKNMKIPKSAAKFDVAKLEEWQQLAVEKWLGWDEDLWFSYHQASYVLGRTGLFVPIPKDISKLGNYGWLLPRYTNGAGVFVRLPRRNISPDSRMIAIMLNMSTLETTTTGSWYYETNTVNNIDYLIDCFVGATMTVSHLVDVETII